jgi:hypothetical protein
MTEHPAGQGAAADPLVGQLPPCPKCGGVLRLEWRLVATGPAMVAGVMQKLAATETPHLICDWCGFVESGKRPNSCRRDGAG